MLRCMFTLRNAHRRVGVCGQGPQCEMPAKRRARVLGFSNVAVMHGVLRDHVLSARGSAKEVSEAVFELSSYSDMPLSGSPECESLIALAPLLVRLLTVAPSGSINQKSLETAVSQVGRLYPRLRDAALSETQWACHLAQQLRCAVSHVRRLRLNHRLLRQRSGGLSSESMAMLQTLLDLVAVEDGEGSDGEGAGAVAADSGSAQSSLLGGPGDGALEPPAASSAPPLCWTPRRRLARKSSEASAASEASLDFASFACSPVPGQPVVVTPAQCGLLLDALLAVPRPAAVGAQGQATASSRAALKRHVRAKVAKRKQCTASTAAPGRYMKMWYKSTGACAVREVGGRQLLQVVVKGAGKEQIEAVADQCLAKLHAGEDLIAVKQWVVEAKERLKQSLAPNVD